MNSVWLSRLATTFLVLGPVIGSAQQLMISHTEGNVYLDGRRVEPSATHSPLKQNSVVLTEDGRVEVLLAPSVILRLNEKSSFRMIANRPNGTRIEVQTGSAVVLTDNDAQNTNPFNRRLAEGVAVLCEDAVTLSNFGVYRFDVHHIALPTHEEYKYCRFKVYKGAATVQLSSASSVVMAGELMNLNRNCGDHIQVNEFDIGDIDAMDRWSPQRAESDAPRQ